MAKGATEEGKKPEFTDREIEIMAAAWSCIESGELKINYEKLAEKLGMGNPRSASNAWANIRKKVFKDAADGAAKATPGKKRTKKDTDGDGDEDMEEGTPAKKTKTPAKKGKKAPLSEEKVGSESPIKGEDDDA